MGAVKEKDKDLPALRKERTVNTEEHAAAAAKIEKAAEKQMFPGGEGAQERSPQKGEAAVKEKDKDLPALGKERTAKREEHATAAKIEKAGEKERVPGGEGAKERSGQKGTAAVKEKDKDLAAVGKERTANTEEHAAAAKIEKAAEKQRVPGGEGAKERSGKKGKAAVKYKDKDLVALRKERTVNTEANAAAAKIQKAAGKQRVPGGEGAQERSGQKGKAAVEDKDKDLPALRKERTVNTEEHAEAAAKIEKATEKQMF